MRQNIRRLRGRMPVTELSEKLTALGRPIPPLGLRRIEDGSRRVDVDDLTSLALALDVSPVTLLMPYTETDDEPAEVTGRAEAVKASILWDWLRTASTLHGPDGGDDGRSAILLEWVTWVRRAAPSWSNREIVGRIERMITEGGDRGDH
ncbi:XRE family transcriptional regulator [Mycobacterium sp. WMMD1722]|uniref:XRE family transcriptional regulator n=1 Tax=Mycobacterium sp. WMMD1722 TaxID=3404117 RepID=UPI003BF4B500